VIAIVNYHPLLVVCSLLLVSCASNPSNCLTGIKLNNTISQTQLLDDLKTLASDEMAGRKTRSAGSLKAQSYITQRFVQSHLESFGSDYLQPFIYGINRNKRGTNIVGIKRGTSHADEFIVVTAHYDHIGRSGSRIYNGADDNASGVSAMLAIADTLSQRETRHSIIFLATDAEEDGLFGAKAFVANPPVKLAQIKYNLNLDMVSQGGSGRRLYVAGTKKNPQLIPLVNEVIKNASVCLKPGHEGPQKMRGATISQPDWRFASDHAPFAKHKIPYLYFGVDLHRHYHEYTDTFDNIDPEFFTAATETILATFFALDKQ